MNWICSLLHRVPEPDGAELLERVAYRLTCAYTQTASFRERGELLPWQAEALSIVIGLQLRADA